MHHTTVYGWSWRRFRVRWIITHAEYWSGISWAEWEDLSEPTSLRQQRATRAELNFLYRDLVNDEDSFLVFRLDNSTRPNSMEIFSGEVTINSLALGWNVERVQEEISFSTLFSSILSDRSWYMHTVYIFFSLSWNWNLISLCRQSTNFLYYISFLSFTESIILFFRHNQYENR